MRVWRSNVQPCVRRLHESAERIHGRGGILAACTQNEFIILLDAEKHQLDGALRIDTLSVSDNLDIGLEAFRELDELCRGTGMKAVANSDANGSLDLHRSSPMNQRRRAERRINSQMNQRSLV